MNLHKLIAAVWVGASLSLGSAALAADQPGCDGKAGTPQQIEGKVVKIDTASNNITIKGSDGTTHVFQASPETLKDYKEGDTIKAKLRCEK